MIPVPNTALEPGSASTTMLYFLHFRPGTGGAESVEVARRFAAEYVRAGPGEFVGVTGTVPATVARAAVIKEWVPVVPLATIVLIAVAAVSTGALVFAELSFFRCSGPPWRWRCSPERW